MLCINHNHLYAATICCAWQLVGHILQSLCSSCTFPVPMSDVHWFLLAAKGAVDGVMTVSAAQALFYNQSAIILSGLPNTTQYVSYPPMPKAGAVSQVRRLCLTLCTVVARSAASWSATVAGLAWPVHALSHAGRYLHQYHIVTSLCMPVDVCLF